MEVSMTTAGDDEIFWSAFREHTLRIVEASSLVVTMLEQHERRDAIALEVRQLEHRGDEIAHAALHALRSHWLTFLDRAEIHGLIMRLDDVLDFVQAAGERIRLYELTHVRSEALDLAKLLVRLARELERAMPMLTRMQDSQPLFQLCRLIGRARRDADAILRQGHARLFREATDIVEILKWRDVFGVLGAAIARADGVGDALQNIALEHP
jgi:uncharacterized protein Yka (UPF0111/DUF47 family)